MEKKRKSFLVKLANRNEETQERVSKWLDSQTNYTVSVISVINHMIERFGYVDVMDYQISKQLYNDLIQMEQMENTEHPETKNEKSKPKEDVEIVLVKEEEPEPSRPVEKETTSSVPLEPAKPAAVPASSPSQKKNMGFDPNSF